MTCDEYVDLVAAHVDGVLTRAESEVVDQHLSACAHCRLLFEEQSSFRTAFAARRVIITTPAETEQRLRHALAQATAEAARTTRFSWRDWVGRERPFPRLTFGFASACAALLLVALSQLFTSSPELSLLSQAAQSYRILVDQQKTLTYSLSEPQELAAALNHSGQLDFVTQVADFQKAGYRLHGGEVMRILSQPAAIAVYSSTDDHILCLRLRGKLPSLPPGAAIVHGHQVHSQDGYTIVSSQFRQHYCLLVSRLPRDQFLQRLGATSEG